ncbi:electron transfer flavoprotein subunit alpha/FixB family protein [Stetteria hydrogenophila]
MVKALIVAGSAREAGEALGSVEAEPVVLAYGEAAGEAGEIAGYGAVVHRLQAESPELVFEAARRLFEEVKPDLVLGPSTRNARDALSRLAGLYDLPMATDVVELSVGGGFVTYKRSILSGRVAVTERAPLPAVLLLARGRFKPPEGRGGGRVEELGLEAEPRVRVVEVREKQPGGPDLEGAEVIVGVGRGFRSREDLKLAFELAELLGGQVACSRPIAADLKWLSEDRWVGLSGRKVAPKLYIAVGISGAPQHVAGITGARVVVAINKDRNAPIFRHADYGVVADLYEFLPVLARKIKERRG